MFSGVQLVPVLAWSNHGRPSPGGWGSLRRHLSPPRAATRWRSPRVRAWWAAPLIIATLLTGQAAHAESPETIEFRRIPGPETGQAVLDVGAAGAFDDQWSTCPTIVRANGQYRMWYSSFYDFSDRLSPRGIGTATSRDGVHWNRDAGGRPVLRPSADGGLDDGQVLAPEVHYDGALYRMWYTGQPKARHVSSFGYYRIFLATSVDGREWKRVGGGHPVLDLGPPGSFDEVQVATPSIVREANMYRMWYAAWSPGTGHTICLAHSCDGVSWQRQNGGRPVTGLAPAAAYGPAVAIVKGRYLMLYMATGASPGLYGATSSDGVRWTMLDATRPLIAPGAPGDFDDSVVGHAFLTYEPAVTGGRLRAWYTGYRREPGGLLPWRLRIGLAEAEW